jgi:site-specific recombinase XerD
MGCPFLERENWEDTLMIDDYEQYEAECERIRRSNEKLLDDFEGWLRNKNLTAKTIRRHSENVDFYINEYLLYDDATEPQEGVGSVSMFLGYWFIKKAMWASAASIKGNAASLKKFYTFLHERESVSKEELDDLKETIEEEMPEWLATLERYDDPSITDMGEVWGL